MPKLTVRFILSLSSSYPRLQTIPMRSGAVKTWRRAVSTWMMNAQQEESNFLSPKQRLRRAAARVPAPGTRLRTRGTLVNMTSTKLMGILTPHPFV